MSRIFSTLAETHTYRGQLLLRLLVLTTLFLLTLNIICGLSIRKLPSPKSLGISTPSAVRPVESTLAQPAGPNVVQPVEPSVVQPVEPSAVPLVESLPCQKIAGAEDVVIVIKTGATEVKDKLPIHLRTTTLCYSDIVIFSDYEEDVEGHHIHDALEQVDENIKRTHDDFALYRRLREYGRHALGSNELSGPESYSGGGGGKTDNAGWRLDKWKFLPMVNRTLTMYPEKKWYVFVETDTYLVWSNLLQWISALDSEKPFYAGSQTQIGDQVFAHGGSGFVVSNAAMNLVTDHHAKNTTWWEEFTSGHWAGDCVLGKAFEEAGVPLKWSWPLTQGEKPSTIHPFEVNYFKRLWCYPAVTYHHLVADEVESVWEFEQSWIENQRALMRHSDVFKMHVLPKLQNERRVWDNLSGSLEEGTEVGTLTECRDVCQARSECMQYRLAAGKCTISDEIKLGAKASTEANMQSGWMTGRIEQAVREVEPCESSDWIL